MMDEEQFKQLYRDFVIQQRLDSEDGDLNAECESDEVSGIEDLNTVYRAFLNTDLSNDHVKCKAATEWLSKRNSDEIHKLLRGVGSVRRESREGDRWTSSLSKNRLCQIINKHCPTINGRPVGSNGSRFFDRWIVDNVDTVKKSKQKYIYNYEHLCSTFDDEAMARAAEDLGAD